MRHAVMLELAVAAIFVLLRHQPVAGAHPRFQAVLAIERRKTRHHAMHDLALVENDRVAAGLAKMAWECAVGGLQRELPVDHLPGALDQFGPVEVLRRSDEGLDDVAGGLGIAGQPAILETPACGDAARVGLCLRTSCARHSQSMAPRRWVRWSCTVWAVPVMSCITRRRLRPCHGLYRRGSWMRDEEFHDQARFGSGSCNSLLQAFGKRAHGSPRSDACRMPRAGYRPAGAVPP